MSEIVGIIGQSGSGKSTSVAGNEVLGIKGLDLNRTFYINVIGKPLPVRGWKKMFCPCKFDYTNPQQPALVHIIPNDTRVPNYIETRNPNEIISFMRYISTDPNTQHIIHGIIDDYQYVIADEFMKKALEKGYDKFSSMAMNGYNVLDEAKNLRGNLITYILTHSEMADSSDGGKIAKIKTIGKMLDEKVTLEGLFRILLFTDNKYDAETQQRSKIFVTNSTNKFELAKSPPGMFATTDIVNDLGLVDEAIRKYDSGE